MVGSHTLEETERVATARLNGLEVDFESTAVISNLFRAANAVRNHMVREVLAPLDLTWTGFVTLWVAWIWGRAETRVIAEEVGVSKATLSGVLNTLESQGLIVRSAVVEDKRLVVVSLTPAGTRLIRKVYPKINAQEAFATRTLNERGKAQAARTFRTIAEATEIVDR